VNKKLVFFHTKNGTLNIKYNGDIMKQKINKELIISIAIPLIIGIISAVLSMNGMQNNYYIKPKLTPPNWVFPVAWTILYILMGISSYLVYKSSAVNKEDALKVYALQLLLNGMWSIIFFEFANYFFALLWIILLDFVVVWMIYEFNKINKKSALLQIPYTLWLLFATYLTLAVYILN